MDSLLTRFLSLAPDLREEAARLSSSSCWRVSSMAARSEASCRWSHSSTVGLGGVWERLGCGVVCRSVGRGTTVAAARGGVSGQKAGSEWMP
ncbi:MAG: hypothetical protein WDW38_009281 [Sanguina aurantia]